MSKNPLLLCLFTATVTSLSAATNFKPIHNGTDARRRSCCPGQRARGKLHNVYLGTTTTLTDAADFRGNQTQEKFWSGGLQSERGLLLAGGYAGRQHSDPGHDAKIHHPEKISGISRKRKRCQRCRRCRLQIRDWKQVAMDFDDFLDEDDLVGSDADFMPFVDDHACE